MVKCSQFETRESRNSRISHRNGRMKFILLEIFWFLAQVLLKYFIAQMFLSKNNVFNYVTGIGNDMALERA